VNSFRVIKALLFDFDGVILDTEKPIYQSWLEVYQSSGCQLPLSEWSKVIGTSPRGFDPFMSLEQQLGHKVDRESIAPVRRKRELELISERPIQPGIHDYLLGARRLGLKTGVASSSSRRWVGGHLSERGLLNYFDCIRTSDDVGHAKPDPELYHAILQCLNILTNQAIAFEDSPNGILAAKQAGLFCVAVPNEITCQLPLDRADLCLNSLAEMPLDVLISDIEKRWNGDDKY